MTLAHDLANTICGVPSEPGVIHDPAQPLILGDVVSNKYARLSFDAINNILEVAVNSPEQTCVYRFDTTGKISQNNVDILDDPRLTDAVNSASASAASAANSASSAFTARGEAQTAATAANDSANSSANSADLSALYASAPEGTDLPSGGESALTYAQRAATVASESRELVIGGNVNNSEIYQAGWLNTERQILTASPIQITIPPDIYTSTLTRKKWGTYRMRAAGGVAQFVPEAGGSVNTAPSLVKIARNIKRYLSSTGAFPIPIQATINIPANFTGTLLAIYTGSHAGNPGAATLPVQAVVSSAQLPTWTTVQAYPPNPASNNYFDWAVFRSSLSNYAGGDVTVNVNGGDNLYFHGLFLYLITAHGTTVQVARAAAPTGVTNFSATLPSVAAKSLCVGVGVQRAISTECAFSSFNANMALAVGGAGNSNGTEETGVSDGSRPKNMVFGMGSGVQNVDGSFLGQANFTSGVGPGGFCLVSFAPLVGGSSPVNLRFENGIDTLTADNGVAELWFEPDGRTVDVRITPEIP